MTDEELIPLVYWRIKPKPEEGTAAAAIRTHSQTIGVIAFFFQMDPDRVAEAVAAAEVSRRCA